MRAALALTVAAVLFTACSSDPSSAPDAATPIPDDASEMTPPDAAAIEPDAGMVARDASMRPDAGPKMYASVTADELCTKYAKASCDRKIRCRTLDASLRALCEKREASSCGQPNYQQNLDVIIPAAVKAGRITFDGILGGQCVGETADLACNITTLPAACSLAVKGTVADAAACYATAECVATAFCYFPYAGGTCPSTCVSYKSAVGDPCGYASKNTCDPKTLRCDYGTSKCVSNAVGATCTYASDCAIGLSCVKSKCAAVAKKGEACGGSTAPGCGPGLFCRQADSTMPGTCQPQIAEGGACAGYNQCQPPLYCNTDGYSIGSCHAPHPLGDTCDAYNSCRESVYCDQDDTVTCRTYPGDKESCASTYSCAAGFECDFSTETCKPLKVKGDSCYFNDECVTGRCAADTSGKSVCSDPCVPM